MPRRTGYYGSAVKGCFIMVRIGKKEKSDKLYQAILQLKDPQECYDFFQDLCTVSELRSMEQRFDYQPCEPLSELWHRRL